MNYRSRDYRDGMIREFKSCPHAWFGCVFRKTEQFSPIMAATKYVKHILDLPRSTKRALALTVDISLCILTIWLAFCLRLNDWVALSGVQLLTIPVSLALALPIFITTGLYRAIFRFIGWSAFVTVIQAVTIYGLAFMAIFTAIGFADIPRTVGIIQPLLLLIAIGLSRFSARYLLYDAYNRILRTTGRKNVLIYGAGHEGRQFGGALGHSADYRVIGYLDDDRTLHGSVIGGIRVFNPRDMLKVCILNNVRTVLLALPHISRKRRNEIIEDLREAQVAVRTVSTLDAITMGNAAYAKMHELDVEDLLGRESVPPDKELIERDVRGGVVMVTGAAGSIGSELCRTLLKLGPSRLIILDQNEFGLYNLQAELSGSQHESITIVPILAHVCDATRIANVIGQWRPSVIYHAAAYKHVPLVEQNPAEGIRTNVFGSLNVAKAASNAGVKRFVLVSTDKAVRPTNVMGASKRIAEICLQALDGQGSATVMTMVRFGNVLGSSGSVVPLFRNQIANGGPLTLTHTEVTRFFMTIPEASQLVIQAGAMGTGGDVFILDMGEPVKILDLARRVVELHGLTIKDEKNPNGDIEILTTGLRPGEKLYEEVLIGNDPQPTAHPKIMRAQERFTPFEELEKKLGDLERFIQKDDVNGIKMLLSEIVEDFEPPVDCTNVDAIDPVASPCSNGSI